MFKAIFIVIIIMLFTAIATVGVSSYFLWTKNPYNIRTCLTNNFFNASSTTAIKNSATKTATSTVEKSNKLLLSSQQENLLQKAGVDINSLPTTISPTMQACFDEKLGVERVKAIKNGAIPNPLEIYKAKSCF